MESSPDDYKSIMYVVFNRDNNIDIQDALHDDIDDFSHDDVP